VIFTNVNATIFELLVGSWRLNREIPGIASFSGRAEFCATKESGVLAYAESGHFAFQSGYNSAASRRLRYSLIGGRIAIKDDDGIRRGVTLHLLNFVQTGAGAVAQHQHVCGRDVYDIVMTILEADRFETQYRVVGPRKDYWMLAVYRRDQVGDIGARG
jgi:hypothetical protein